MIESESYIGPCDTRRKKLFLGVASYVIRRSRADVEVVAESCDVETLVPTMLKIALLQVERSFNELVGDD